jgi:hypothetical protein
MAPVARDARPPLLLVRAMNPVMRRMLRTPLGRLVRPFALLEFRGRRSGRVYRVPVGYHEIDDGLRVVFTPAPWRVNLRGGIPVTLRFRGQTHHLVGTLDDDPASIAAALQAVADRTGSLKPVGVDIPAGHRVTADDVVAVDRAVIWFTPSSEA